MTVQDVITDALKEIGVISQGDTPSFDDIQDGLTRFNRMMDRWAARGIAAYNVSFSLFTLQANHSPHTIGPSGDFNVTQRPVKIPAASVILGSGATAVDLPLGIRDDDWWAENRTKAITSSLPTNLYYSPDWPKGSCYFWPIPTSVYQVRLELWGAILGSSSALGDAFSLPPGYWDAATTNLAILLAPAYGAAAQVTPELRMIARDSLATIESNNAQSPRIRTNDAGMPSGGRSVIPGFSFLTGEPW